MKQLTYSATAAKNLRVYGNMAKRLMKAMRKYADDQSAHANNVTKLVGSSAKRMRVGDYRIIFEETETEIVVTKIAPRGSVYEGR